MFRSPGNADVDRVDRWIYSAFFFFINKPTEGNLPATACHCFDILPRGRRLFWAMSTYGARGSCVGGARLTCRKSLPSLWMLPLYPEMFSMKLASLSRWGSASINSCAFCKSLVSSPSSRECVIKSCCVTNRLKGEKKTRTEEELEYLEEDLEVVDALNGQFEVFAQSLVVADPVAVFL